MFKFEPVRHMLLTVFKRDILNRIIQENRFGFEPEFTAKTQKLDLRIFEVGVKIPGRKYSEGKNYTKISCI